MAKISGKYEVLYVIDPAVGEEGIAALVEKFKALVEGNGTITSIDEWGKRRLAYPINDKAEGYYVVVTFKAEPAFPAEFERLCKIDESILRSMVVRLDFEPAVKAAEPVATEAAPAVEEAPVADAE